MTSIYLDFVSKIYCKYLYTDEGEKTWVVGYGGFYLVLISGVYFYFPCKFFIYFMQSSTMFMSIYQSPQPPAPPLVPRLHHRLPFSSPLLPLFFPTSSSPLLLFHFSPFPFSPFPLLPFPLSPFAPFLLSSFPLFLFFSFSLFLFFYILKYR